MQPWMIVTTCAPLLILQGRHVRRVTPELPPARGEPIGLAGAHGPLLRLLIAGDSSAAGVGVAALDEAMAGVLPAALARRRGCRVRRQLVARIGLTAAGVRELLDQQPAPMSAPESVGEFDAAVIVVGVNDVTQRRSRQRWLADLQALRARLRERAPQAPLLWSGLPPMHRFPALPNPLRAYLGGLARQRDDDLARWVAADRTMRHVPIPVLSGEGTMASDGFHPGPAGHRLWGELLAERVDEMLGAAPVGGSGPVSARGPWRSAA